MGVIVIMGGRKEELELNIERIGCMEENAQHKPRKCASKSRGVWNKEEEMKETTKFGLTKAPS